MKEIKYFVRTTNDRIYEYDLEHEKLIDTEHAPVKSFINQLKYISQWDSVLLEDDLILCKDFSTFISFCQRFFNILLINFNYYSYFFIFYTFFINFFGTFIFYIIL